MVLCVDEKSRIQALDRTGPLRLGYAEGVTHHHVRHGATSPSAAEPLAALRHPPTRPASSSKPAIRKCGHFFGRLRRVRSFKRSRDYVNLFLGHDTRR